MSEYKYLKKWTKPDCYAGASWPDWYVGLGRNRDSCILDESNFDVFLALVKQAAKQDQLNTGKPMSDLVYVVREGHWACGWIEWIAIHKDAVNACQEADMLLCELEDYPVLNEDDYSDRQWNAAWEHWESLRPKERLDYLREENCSINFDTFGELLRCVKHGDGFLPDCVKEMFY